MEGKELHAFVYYRNFLLRWSQHRVKRFEAASREGRYDLRHARIVAMYQSQDD